MKRQIIAVILAAVLCFTMIPFASFGDSGSAETKTMSDGSSWTVDGNNYTTNSRIGWPNFSTYKLGDLAAGETVMISSVLRVGKGSDEATNNGGDSGYLFGITDLNGDGKIAEADDQYYLVELSGYDDGGFVNVVIDRGDKNWSPVKSGRYYCSNHDLLELTVVYDSSTGTIIAYVNGSLVVTYTDGSKFTGTGYALASKITGGVFKGVEAEVGKTPDWLGIGDSAEFALQDDVYDSIIIPYGKTVTIDLNGHYVFEPVINFGTLTLTDSKGDGFIEVRKQASYTNDRMYAIDNFGKLTIDGATVMSVTANGGVEGVGIYNRQGATLSVKSGIIQSICEKDKYNFAIQNLGTIDEISGGKIISEMVYRVCTNNNCAITNDGGTINKITGGEIFARTNGNGENMYGVAIRNRNGGHIGEISGGYIHTEVFGSGVQLGFGILNDGASSVIDKISGGTIEAYTTATKWVFGINNSNGRIGEISGGLIRAFIDHTDGNNAIAIANSGTGVISAITGGVFCADGISGGKIAVRCNDTSTVTSITGGAFYGADYLLNNGATAGIAAGYALSDAQASGYKYVTNGAVSENATADGIVGTTGGKSYTLYTASEKASVGATVYDSAAAAIEAAGDGATVKLLGNSSTAITVPAGKNITIDLNGTTQRGKLTNNGTVKLIDGNGTGRIIAKSDVNGELMAVDNYGTLTVDGANIRTFGLGGGTQAFAIKNEKNAHLTVLSGKIQSTTRSTNFSLTIKNYGTIDKIAGGEIGAEISLPIGASSGTNMVGIAQVEGAVLKEMAGGNIWARANNNGGDGCYTAAIRNQGGSTIEKITGGTMRAYGYRSGDSQRVSFGIYNENGTIGEISGGFIAGYTSAMNFTFGLKNDVNGVINSITGGYFLAEKDTDEGGGNIIGLANWGKVESISGGTFRAYLFHRSANTYSIRSTGAGHYANLSGGRFITSREFANDLYTTDSGVNRIAEGYYVGGADRNGVREIKNSKDYGKVIYALGSSVTYGAATAGNSFADKLDMMLEDTAVIKNAISGTTLFNNDAGSYVARLQSGFNGYKAPDLLIVQLSTNDATQNKPLGTLDPEKWSDFNDQTIIGAIEFIINYAKTNWGCDVVFYTNPKYDSAAYKAMVDAMPSIAEKWDIDVVDFYNYTDMEPVANLSVLMNDSIHPNAAGYVWMAEVFADYLDVALAPAPEIISGATAEYEKESGEDIVIVANVDPERIEAVEIDGEELDADDYTVTAGDNGTVITISSTVFDGLTVEDHTVTIVTRAGDLNATVTVTEAAQTTETGTDETETGTDETETGTGETEVTETGDATVFIIILAVIVSLSIAVITLGKRKVTE